MSKIVLLKMSGEDQVEMRMSTDITWMEVSERFVNFLQACGYQVTGADIAAHLGDVYGYSIDRLDVSWPMAGDSTITVTSSDEGMFGGAAGAVGSSYFYRNVSGAVGDAGHNPSEYNFKPLDTVMNTWTR